MKIYLLPVPPLLQPSSQPFKYPSHNSDYGVEQDFQDYLRRTPHLLVSNPAEADWHYLPVYWTRWHLNHDYGKTGLKELNAAVQPLILNDRKTFTICQYDDGPLAFLGAATVFLASRKTQEGIDIPLLCSPHRLPFFRPARRYLASFLGRVESHPIRERMLSAIRDRPDVLVRCGDGGTRTFVRMTLRSYTALSPRGYGGSSFRLFEAMQMGVAPLLVSDLDTRPFKRFLDWESCSLFSDSPENLPRILDSLTPGELLAMGQRAAVFYRQFLGYQKWCPFVWRELEHRT